MDKHTEEEKHAKRAFNWRQKNIITTPTSAAQPEGTTAFSGQMRACCGGVGIDRHT